MTSGWRVLDDDRREAFAQLHRLAVVSRALLDLVREADRPARLVVERDEDGVRLEQAADALADDLGDGLEVELRGQGGADLVDQAQFGRALVGLGQQALGLVEEARVLEGHAHAEGERRDEPFVGLTVGPRLRVGQADDADDLAAGRDGHAQPGLGRCGALGEDRARRDLISPGCPVAADAWR